MKSKQVWMKSKSYGFDEIKSFFYPCGTRFHHEVISSAKQISSVGKTDLTEKSTDQVDAFFWWREMDSNHRSETQQIYSLPPLATREPLRIIGAGDGTRTRNLLITNQLLCQLSYTS